MWPTLPLLPFLFFCFVLIGTRRATTSTFCFLAFFSGLVQMGFAGAQGWLESPVVYLPFDSEIESYCRWRDLQWPWMLRRQRVWGHLPYRAFIIYPNLGVDLSKLLLVKSPKTQIAWHLIPWKTEQNGKNSRDL